MWRSPAAWMGSSGGSSADCGSRVSRGFRWMWACVRPRHRATSVRLTGLCCRMTRLCCRRDKDKLQPLENISTFFFSLSLLLYSSFLFFAIGCSPNVCHTKGRWWRGVGVKGSLWKNILGGKKLPLTIHRSGTVFYRETYLPSPALCTWTVNASPSN